MIVAQRLRREASVPLRWQNGHDWRSRGSVSEFLRDYLASRPDGALPREALEAATASFGSVRNKPRGFRGIVRRLIERGEVVETDGKLFITGVRRGSERRYK